jgi:putative transposase
MARRGWFSVGWVSEALPIIRPMTDYRRNRIPGATYFFTVNLLDRRSDLLLRKVDVLRNAVRDVRTRMPFHINAWVVLPEHMHCIWTLPEGDIDFSGRWRAVKTNFSRAMPMGERRSESRIGKGERGIWQRRFWEHTIRDERDYVVHMDYIHFNPVKHGLVEHVRDWPYSSFHRCVAKGFYPPAWSMDGKDFDDVGERGPERRG